MHWTAIIATHETMQHIDITPAPIYKNPRFFGLIIVAAYILPSFLFPGEWRTIDAVNLVIHEAGHTITFFLPQLLTILSGSVFQVLVPLVFAGYFFLRGDRFSSYVTLLWAAQSLVNVAIYARDAEVMQLELLGGDGVIHDWNYLLSNLHIVHYATLVGGIIYMTALCLFVVSMYGAFRAINRR